MARYGDVFDELSGGTLLNHAKACPFGDVPSLMLQSRNRDRPRIVFDCRMLNDAATIRDSTMKTILMLAVGLILAGCGLTENHVRNRGVGAASTSAGPVRVPVTVLLWTRSALVLDD